MGTIYLDNAATSHPKPEAVYQAVDRCLRETGASTGSGVHRRASAAADLLHRARSTVGRLVGARNPACIVFTANATEALNLALKGILRPGDHVVTSTLEHNAVWRPLARLAAAGRIEVTPVAADGRGVLRVEDVRAAIRGKTRLIALAHASNVTGGILPVTGVGELARERGIVFLVDAAQTAGSEPIGVDAMPVDLLAFTGHKRLLGPMGTGGLFVRDGIELVPLKEGGTAGLDAEPGVPDRLEAGTLNLPGIAGLLAGVEYLLERSVESVRQHERALSGLLLERLGRLPGVQVYGPPAEARVGLVSFNVRDLAPGYVAAILDREYGILVRPGLHGSPLAHRTIGTLERGAVRMGAGVFNTTADVLQLAEAVKAIAAR